jgi:hypothetical protein
MSTYRLEKHRRVNAKITFLSNVEIKGRFFLGDAVSTHIGPERVSDLLNQHERFFPFEVEGGEGKKPYVAIYSRAHIVLVELDPADADAEADPSLELAAPKLVSLLFSSGTRVRGELHVVAPEGQSRVSDFANAMPRFQHFTTRGVMSLVNLDHVVEILPISE